MILSLQLHEARSSHSFSSGILRVLKADSEGRPIKLRVTKDTNEDRIIKELEDEGWGQVNGVSFPTKTTAEIDWVDHDNNVT